MYVTSTQCHGLTRTKGVPSLIIYRYFRNKKYFFAFCEEEYYDEEEMRKSHKVGKIWEAVSVFKLGQLPYISRFTEGGILCGRCWHRFTDLQRDGSGGYVRGYNGKFKEFKRRTVIMPGMVECPKCQSWLYWRRLDAKPDDQKELGRKIILEAKE